MNILVSFIVGLVLPLVGFLTFQSTNDGSAVGAALRTFIPAQLDADISDAINGDCLSYVDSGTMDFTTCAGGGSSLHVDGGGFVYPQTGDYHSAPKYVATSTTAASTFVLASTTQLTNSGLSWFNDTLTFSGVTTDITTGTNESLSIAPNGTGDFFVNTDDLYVDTSTGNVGIGTTTPNTPLHVGGAANTALAGTKLLVVSDSISPGGMEVRNTNNSAFSDARIASIASDGSYVVVGQPAPINALTLFGQTRGQTSFVFNFAGSEGGAARNLAIGTFDNKDVVLGTNNTERIRITNAGNVGIGDSSPAALLTVGAGDLFQVNSSGLAFTPRGTAAAPAYSFTADTDTGMYSGTTDELAFATAGARRMNIDAAGYISFGVASGAINGSAAYEFASDSATRGILYRNADAGILMNYTSGANVATLQGRGANGVGNDDLVVQNFGGNFGIVDTTPAYLLTVGTGDLFGVNSSGAIAAITGLSGATGDYDFGGAGSLEIPNGTNPTTDAAGEIALDTTDNQLIVDNGTTDGVLPTEQYLFGVTIASTSVEFVSGGEIPVPLQKDGYTVTNLKCYVQGGTSAQVTFTDNTNAMDTITCGTTATTDDGTIANSTVTADELMYLDIGTISGTPDYVIFSVFGRWTRE